MGTNLAEKSFLKGDTNAKSFRVLLVCSSSHCCDVAAEGKLTGCIKENTWPEQGSLQATSAHKITPRWWEAVPAAKVEGNHVIGRSVIYSIGAWNSIYNSGVQKGKKLRLHLLYKHNCCLLASAFCWAGRKNASPIKNILFPNVLFKSVLLGVDLVLMWGLHILQSLVT